MTKLDAALVTEVRPWIPLLRELRAAGFEHVTYGGLFGDCDHSWIRRDDAARWAPVTEIERETRPNAFVLERTDLLGECTAVRIRGRLTPEQARVILAAFGIVTAPTAQLAWRFDEHTGGQPS